MFVPLHNPNLMTGIAVSSKTLAMPVKQYGGIVRALTGV
jgi:hypothetical protein